MMTAKLGNILTNKERQEIKKELHDMRNGKFTKTLSEIAVNRLNELADDLKYKQRQHISRHHYKTYFGIKDIEHLLNEKIHY